MTKKVDISEVIEFSSDFSRASENLKTQLKEVENSIEQLQSMDNFTGEAASNAKSYFSEVHLTVLKSFDLVLKELDERLDTHVTRFKSRVDSSETAIVTSGYLSSTATDLDETDESLKEEQERVREALADVSDISSAGQPRNMIHDSTYDKVKEVITDLKEDLERYSDGEIENASEIDQLHQQIETTIKDSGEVTEDNKFIYTMGTTTPESLLNLQVHNEETHKDMMESANESRDRAIEDLDDESGVIASKAAEDLDNGVIEEDEYYTYLAELRNLYNQENPDENVSPDFLQYVANNAQEIAGTAENATLTAIITQKMKDGATNAFNQADAMNAKNPGSGSQMNKHGNKLNSASKYVGGSLSAVSTVYGTYQDYKHTDKTMGESITKNVYSTAFATAGSSAGATGVLVIGGSATPVGWVVVGSVVVGTGATAGYNYMYDNNVLGMQDSLDWLGQKLDKVGEASIKSIKEGPIPSPIMPFYNLP